MHAVDIPACTQRARSILNPHLWYDGNIPKPGAQPNINVAQEQEIRLKSSLEHHVQHEVKRRSGTSPDWLIFVVPHHCLIRPHKSAGPRCWTNCQQSWECYYTGCIPPITLWPILDNGCWLGQSDDTQALGGRPHWLVWEDARALGLTLVLFIINVPQIMIIYLRVGHSSLVQEKK